MRVLFALILLAIPGFSVASTDANVFIFQKYNLPKDLNTPKLSPEQAKLVFAQRLGVSHHHELGNACESTLSHINQFGAKQEMVFENPGKNIPELLLIVEGVSFDTLQLVLAGRPSIKTNFQISRKSSMDSSVNLFTELQVLTRQVETHSLEASFKLFDKSNWSENSKIVHVDLFNKKDAHNEMISTLKQAQRSADRGEMNSAVILIPQSLNDTNPYWDFSDSREKLILQKRQVAEEPIISSSTVSPFKEASPSSISISTPIKGLLPVCFTSLDTCISSTRNCSGNGQCIKKYEDRDNKGACFSCECRATNETIIWAQGSKKGWKISYWGGSACHKKDVSSAFWLIFIFSTVMIGTTFWAIGMLFNIGQEKLPGVIGAGVSSKARQG